MQVHTHTITYLLWIITSRDSKTYQITGCSIKDKLTVMEMISDMKMVCKCVISGNVVFFYFILFLQPTVFENF